jgi:pyruvate dehydrogenase E2 component (dihydrolipoamide acetyltransferase)
VPDLPMPRLSDSMEEGTILKWLKSDGEQVAVGDELVEIETDKANMTHEAEQSGVLRIVAREGETLPVGATIAQIGESNGAAPAVAAQPEPEPAAPAEPVVETGEVKVSPVARRMAKELGVDLGKITGTGPGGRITKADVQPDAPVKPAPVAAPAPREGAKGTVEARDLSRLQQTIARRMAESKATAPEFVVALEVEMDAAAEMRAELKALADGGPVPSFNDFVIKAAATALREFPRANGAYRDGRFELYSRVNVGVAVAAQEALVVPTVFDADRKSLGQIGADVRALAEKVRAGTVTPPELSGGTFTVSNLGMYGMKRITPVINPPQAAILGVGEMAPRAVVREGRIVTRSMMDLTLVCDHRILYGADAAEFLARIRALLEAPLRLAL